jgi:16S rRNA (cytosine967-C5)-methyltransferase
VKANAQGSKVSPARAAAFDILLRVERESSYASELLHSSAYASLSLADHGLTTELVMGVLRWRSLLDLWISEASSQPLARLDLEILMALRLAVYQLRWLNRIPARAAIHESVELVKRARKRSAAAFVNAVLRKLSSVRDLTVPAADGSSSEKLAESTANPLWLVERWVREYGSEAAQQICEYGQSPPVTTIRLRNLGAEEKLRAEGIKLVPATFLHSARWVTHGDVTKTAAFRDGEVTIQDEASQLVALLVGQADSVLDCCAAPGGKTKAIADKNPEAKIIAADFHLHRARLLRRLTRTDREIGRTAHIEVITADARNMPFAGGFERVLADVPCSGTGTLARNPEIKWRLRREDFIDLQARQIAILLSAMAQVRAGGRVVYSTCSLEREENEDVVKQAMDGNQSFRVVDCEVELERLRREGEFIAAKSIDLTRGSYLRTVPGLHACDGFFAAILEKA